MQVVGIRGLKTMVGGLFLIRYTLMYSLSHLMDDFRSALNINVNVDNV